MPNIVQSKVYYMHTALVFGFFSYMMAYINESLCIASLRHSAYYNILLYIFLEVQVNNLNVSQVIWVEHLECQKSIIPTMYRSIVNSGIAFGARHWIATLQQQCERLVFFMATNVPTKDSSGKPTKTLPVSSLFKICPFNSTNHSFLLLNRRCCHIGGQEKHSEIGTKNDMELLPCTRSLKFPYVDQGL